MTDAVAFTCGSCSVVGYALVSTTTELEEFHMKENVTSGSLLNWDNGGVLMVAEVPPG